MTAVTSAACRVDVTVPTQDDAIQAAEAISNETDRKWASSPSLTYAETVDHDVFISDS